jgi:hypothetical protein
MYATLSLQKVQTFFLNFFTGGLAIVVLQLLDAPLVNQI